MKLEPVNKVFPPLIYYKLLQVPSYETQSWYNSSFRKQNISTGGDGNGSKSSYGPMLHSYIWIAYRHPLQVTRAGSMSSTSPRDCCHSAPRAVCHGQQIRLAEQSTQRLPESIPNSSPVLDFYYFQTQIS
jgi:hypothetical protein